MDLLNTTIIPILLCFSFLLYETTILQSDQTHMLIVKGGDPQTFQTVETIGVLTSQVAINTGVGFIENIKLNDTQVSGQKKINL